ncbi:MAG TPA: hypothetical protein VF444_01570 [Pseudonocardiaceae bacterium]
MIPDATEIEQAQQELVTLVGAQRAAFDQDPPDVREANRRIKAINILVAGWAEQGGDKVVQAILLPLLNDPSPDIRCAAAAYVLRHGAADQALPVLQAIAEDMKLGDASSQADSVLMVWEDEQRNAQ